MRKALLLFALLLLLGTPAEARVGVGTVFGWNEADVNARFDGRPLKSSSITAYWGGFVFELGLTDRVSVLVEPMYLRKGGRFEYQFPFVGLVEAEPKGDYLEIPLLLKFSALTGRLRPYLIAGASFGFRMHADIRVQIEDQSGEFDAGEVTEPHDRSLLFGGGVELRLDAFSVFAEARTSLGQSDVWRGGEIVSYTLDDAEVTTEGLQLMVGVTRFVGRGSR